MNYIITTTDGETIQHHGILGQKWGVMNGPPYPLDAKDHNANEIKEGYKKSIGGDRNEELYERNRKAERQKRKTEKKAQKEEKREKQNEALKNYYLKQGQTEAQAIKSAETYKKIMKGMAIAGATAILAGGAIYAYSKLDKYGKDFIIRKGQSIYRVASADTTGLRDTFYATPDKMDYAKYRAKWGKISQWGKGTIYKAGKEFTANKDIRIASDQTARKLFEDLIKKNPDFLQETEKIKKMYSKFNPDANPYELFNTYAPLQRDDMSKGFEIFKKYLQDNGFDGLIDFNDKYGKGYGTKAPIIFFGGDTNFSLKSITKLDSGLIAEAELEYQKLAQKDLNVNAFLDNAGTSLPIYGASFLAIAGIEAGSLNSMTKNLNKSEKSK